MRLKQLKAHRNKTQMKTQKYFSGCLILIGMGLLMGCAAMKEKKNNKIEKDAILDDIHYYIKSIVSVASYKKKASDVFNAMYIVVTKEYSQIVRESESKGYIEAKYETDTYIVLPQKLIFAYEAS